MTIPEVGRKFKSTFALRYLECVLRISSAYAIDSTRRGVAFVPLAASLSGVQGGEHLAADIGRS
jgi:hypothetical protein